MRAGDPNDGMRRVPVGIYGCIWDDKLFDHYEMRTILSFSINEEERKGSGRRQKVGIGLGLLVVPAFVDDGLRDACTCSR